MTNEGGRVLNSLTISLNFGSLIKTLIKESSSTSIHATSTFLVPGHLQQTEPLLPKVENASHLLAVIRLPAAAQHLYHLRVQQRPPVALQQREEHAKDGDDAEQRGVRTPPLGIGQLQHRERVGQHLKAEVHTHLVAAWSVWQRCDAPKAPQAGLPRAGALGAQMSGRKVGSRLIQCSAVQCSAVQSSAVECSAVQCSAVECSAVQCSAVQCSAVQCSVV